MTKNSLAVIGSGPAAITAAIYASRSGIDTTVYERGNIGGSLTEIAHIANFPGFTGKGEELVANLRAQAQESGVSFKYGECTAIEKSDDGFKLKIDDELVSASAVLIATGSEPRTMELDTKKPISYCVLCDAPLYKDKDVLVIGGGNSAVGEAIHLAETVKSVTLVNRSPLRAEKALQDKLKAYKNTKIYENVSDFAPFIEKADGIFVLIGKQPASGLIKDIAAQFDLAESDVLDDCGYIITKDNNMTKIPGIFAAGDVRQGSTKQAVTAAADGAEAAIGINKFLHCED